MAKLPWSKRFYERDYIVRLRHPYICKFLDACDFVELVHISGTRNEVYPLIPKGSEWIRNQWTRFKRHHSSYSGYMLAATYALANDMDWCYIEHDCLVFGLDKALAWARGNGIKLAYGYDPYTRTPGWVEQSFQFVANAYLPTYLERMTHSRLHEDTSDTTPELLYAELFEDDASHWPNGYGRTRPAGMGLDWPLLVKDEWFYAQQLTDGEIDGFLLRY